jgi:hypothetical protein
MRKVLTRYARSGTALAFAALAALGVEVAVASIPATDGTIAQIPQPAHPMSPQRLPP